MENRQRREVLRGPFSTGPPPSCLERDAFRGACKNRLRGGRGGRAARSKQSKPPGLTMHPHTGFSSAAGGSGAGADRSSTDFSSSAMRDAIASRSTACAATRASASAARASAAAASAFFFRREPFRLSFGLFGLVASPSTFFFFFDLRRFGLGFSGRSAGSASPSNAISSSPGDVAVGEAASLAVTRARRPTFRRGTPDERRDVVDRRALGRRPPARRPPARRPPAPRRLRGRGAAAPPNYYPNPSGRCPRGCRSCTSSRDRRRPSLSPASARRRRAAWLVALRPSRSTGPAASAALPAYSTVASAASRITGPATSAARPAASTARVGGVL